MPRVIITNYLTSPTNCIASSSFYSVCCMDECEGLLGHLEREIAAPEATSARIATVVSHLSSSSVVAPRKLPQALLDRLEEIASHHGGSVPLHGRLFSQWLHHAFPRECIPSRFWIDQSGHTWCWKSGMPLVRRSCITWFLFSSPVLHFCSAAIEAL